MASTETAGPSTSVYSNLKEKQAERLKKLRDLHLKRNEARQLNHAEVVEEDKRNKLPSNHEARRRRAEWILDDEQKRNDAEERVRMRARPRAEWKLDEKDAKERGKDYNREKLLDVGADEAERKERKKRKKNPDPGFSDFEQATFRQYSRQIKQVKPDFDGYRRQKEKMGDSFYATTSTIVQGATNDTPEAIDKMVNDLEKQISRRDKYSRRRRHDPDEDIDYINERNMKFNKKLERFYGQYTTEIKQNLERGTAV